MMVTDKINNAEKCDLDYSGLFEASMTNEEDMWDPMQMDGTASPVHWNAGELALDAGHHVSSDLLYKFIFLDCECDHS